MGFNKRYIDKKILESYKLSGLSYLIKSIKSADCVIADDDFSQEVCHIIMENSDKIIIKKKLKDLGFTEIAILFILMFVTILLGIYPNIILEPISSSVDLVVKNITAIK